VWTTFTRGKDSKWAPTAATLFSTFNASAAALCGSLSDIVVRRGVPRAHLLAWVYIGTAGIMVTLAIMQLTLTKDEVPVSEEVAFLILLSSVAFAFGANFGITPTVVGELYGLENYGKYFGFLQIGGAVAALSMPNLAAAVFDSQHSFVIMFFALAGLLLVSATLMLSCVPSEFDPFWGKGDPVAAAQRLKQQAAIMATREYQSTLIAQYTHTAPTIGEKLFVQTPKRSFDAHARKIASMPPQSQQNRNAAASAVSTSGGGGGDGGGKGRVDGMPPMHSGRASKGKKKAGKDQSRQYSSMM
jgi:hypothetical protein